jgi:hypothetical protein
VCAARAMFLNIKWRKSKAKTILRPERFFLESVPQSDFSGLNAFQLALLETFRVFGGLFWQFLSYVVPKEYQAGVGGERGSN